MISGHLVINTLWPRVLNTAISAIVILLIGTILFMLL